MSDQLWPPRGLRHGSRLTSRNRGAPAVPYVKVMAEYDCHPLWVYEDGPPANTDPSALPISAGLADALRRWADVYDATLNRGDPSASGFTNPAAEDAFYAEGLMLACGLAIELADRMQVQYVDRRYTDVRPVTDIDIGTLIRAGRSLHLPLHWWDLTDEPVQRDALATQLRRELPPGHVLHARSLTVVARCDRCDDILLDLVDNNEYAVVHLTWRQGPEIAPQWPSTEIHNDPVALLADLTDRHMT